MLWNVLEWMLKPYVFGIFGIVGDLLSGIFGGGDDDGGGGGQQVQIDVPPPLLSGEQRAGAVQGLQSFQDLPTAPIGQAGRGVLQERLDPNFVPFAFQPNVLNPFVQSSFRLGREQLERDIGAQQAFAQQQGGFFSPDLPQLQQQTRERQNLNEQDFLNNLLFQGGQLRETLTTDALARAFGLESQTAGVLDSLLARDLQSQQLRANTQLGAASAIPISTTTGGFGGQDLLGGLGLDQILNDGGGFGGGGGLGGGGFGGLEQLFPELLQQLGSQAGITPQGQGFLPGGGGGGGGGGFGSTAGGGGGQGGGLFGFLQGDDAGDVFSDPQTFQQIAQILQLLLA